METKIIGNKITVARKKLVLSQADLAQRLFISPQAVGKWERGESIPDIITLNRLAEILGVDLNYFSENFSSAVKPEDSLQKDVAVSTLQQSEGLKWDMSGGNWVDADFSGLKKLQEKFSSSNLVHCKFVGSDLSKLLLKGNNVDGCDFSGSDMSGSHVQRSNLSENSFKGCLLNEAEFSGSYLSACDFTDADLTGTTFKTGGLERDIMINTILKRTSFVETHLVDILFGGVMDDCYFEHCSFKRVTFENATLRNTFFKNKSLKHVQFINCQADRITYEFLKSGKADLSSVSLC